MIVMPDASAFQILRWRTGETHNVGFPQGAESADRPAGSSARALPAPAGRARRFPIA